MEPHIDEETAPEVAESLVPSEASEPVSEESTVEPAAPSDGEVAG